MLINEHPRALKQIILIVSSQTNRFAESVNHELKQIHKDPKKELDDIQYSSNQRTCECMIIYKLRE